ncbi:MAG: flagellar hook assembly protein FlgD [Rhodobacteraceae bacterium]|nr:flagellar hook assembly protein FlgD [Paracoccaceae bacterium]MCW9042525.1 flagellar hook assembly protein FlgD [Pseudopelagicola sp.]
MDAISPNTAYSAASNTTKENAGMSGDSSDYETFLKMLTAQMQNQDPLNPVEASDFAAQLASFSTVEQQVLTNDLLTSIEARLANSDFAALADWVGMEARSRGAVYFDGAEITATVQRESAADRNDLVVRNDAGAEVYRATIDPEALEVTWGGETQSGSIAPHGQYELSIEGFSSGESLGSAVLETYGRVQEARVEESGLTLVLAGGQVVATRDVTALRAPL